MDQLPLEIATDIFRELDDLSQIRLSRVNRQFHLLSTQFRCESRFSFYNACKGGKLVQVRNFIFQEEHGYEASIAIIAACKGRQLQIVRLLLRNIDNSEWGSITFAAFDSGDTEVINLIVNRTLQRGRFYLPFACNGACNGGHTNIVKRLFENNADIRHSYLHYACESGNADLARFILGKMSTINGDRFLGSTCYGGNKDLVNLAIASGATEFEFGFRRACAGNKPEIIHMMMERIPSQNNTISTDSHSSIIYCDRSMVNVIMSRFNIGKLHSNTLTDICLHGRTDLLDLVDLSDCDRNLALSSASRHPQLLRHLIRIIPTVPDLTRVLCKSVMHPQSIEILMHMECESVNWTEVLESACELGERLTAELILSFYSPIKWESIINKAACGGNMRLLTDLISRSRQAINWDSILFHACEHERMNIVEFALPNSNVDRVIRNISETSPKIAQLLLSRGQWKLY